MITNSWRFAFAPCEPAGALPAGRKEYAEELNKILAKRAIRTVFQPIVSLGTGEVFGYEALSRGPAGSPLEQPVLLFETARNTGRLWELDSLCRLIALETIAKLSLDCNFFINIDPHVINDVKYMSGFTRRHLDEYHIDSDRIIFEITEHSRIPDNDLFMKAIENYRAQGYQIAIDDSGTGYSGLKLIADLNPQYIKLDMDLIRNVNQDQLKQALVKSMCDFCKAVNIKIIAEGIETECEMLKLIDLGVQYGQGYFLGRPESRCTGVAKEPLKLICARAETNKIEANDAVTVGDICAKCPSITPSALCREAHSFFETHAEAYGLPVVDNGIVVGLIARNNFYTKLGSRFGYDLYMKRKASMLMDKTSLIVDDRASIEQVSRLAMMRSHERLYNSIIVERDGRYLGLVSIKDLLEATINIQVAKARLINPLTGLPGNIAIQKRLLESIHNKSDHVLYLDIDDFKAYNDAYGFQSGDRIILFVAVVMQTVLSEYDGRNAFAGHIGGDDFIVVLDQQYSAVVCKEILSRFDEGIVTFFTEEHRQNGGFDGQDRHGNNVHHSITSLSIAVVSTTNHHFCDTRDLSEHATRLKTACKQIIGSCYLLD